MISLSWLDDAVSPPATEAPVRRATPRAAAAKAPQPPRRSLHRRPRSDSLDSRSCDCTILSLPKHSSPPCPLRRTRLQQDAQPESVTRTESCAPEIGSCDYCHTLTREKLRPFRVTVLHPVNEARHHRVTHKQYAFSGRRRRRIQRAMPCAVPGAPAPGFA